MTQVTVKVTKWESEDIKGFANIYLCDGAVKINCVIREGKDGLWLAMPSHLDKKKNKYVNDVEIYTSYGDRENPVGDALKAEIMSQITAQLSAIPAHTPTTGTNPTAPKHIPF